MSDRNHPGKDASAERDAPEPSPYSPPELSDIGSVADLTFGVEETGGDLSGLIS